MNATTLFEHVDRAATQYANQLAGRSTVVDKLVHDVVDLSFFNGGVFLAAFWWLWFESDATGAYPHRRNVVVALLAATIVGGAARLLKILLAFHHSPLLTPDLGLRPTHNIDPTSLPALGSLPSSHAALFFALSVALWMRSRWLGAAAAVWTLLVICFPLIYLGYHWPSDVLAGALVGVALMPLLVRLIGATRLADRVVRFSATHPPAFYAIAWLFALQMALLFDIRDFVLDAAGLARALLF